MKLDKICRTCLLEKANLKPIFGACVANMLMTLASIQVLEGDGLPHQICTQCLQNINRAYSFKQLCEKSDAELRQYLNSSLQPSIQTIINDVKSDIFGPEDALLPQASIFSDIFNDATTHSLIVDNFDPNPSSVVSDLAETMQSLQTIAEQCLPDTWDSDAQLVDSVSDASACLNIDGFALQSLDFKCQFCNCEFKDEWLLAEHIKSHTAQTKYYCSVCSKVFDSSTDLNKHFIEHCLESNDLQQFVNQQSQKKSNNNCEICDRSFNDFQSLRKHLRDCHFLFDTFMDAKQHSCSICGKRFKQNKHLQVHMRIHTGEKPHVCNICGKQFAFFNSLHKHKSVHNGRQFNCHICGKSFNQSSNLNAHLLLHTGAGKKFTCTVCQKIFTTNKNLEVHMAGHTGIKNFPCTGCPQAFATNAQLKRHMRIHSGEKPYCCWQCGKAFRRKETRDIHQRYHTGERPFSCSICQEKFVAGNHLKAHLKTHSADKNHFECMTCLKKFSSMRALRFHIMTHTGEKPHQCTFCNKQFVQSAGLKLHLENVHNKT